MGGGGGGIRNVCGICVEDITGWISSHISSKGSGLIRYYVLPGDKSQVLSIT